LGKSPKLGKKVRLTLDITRGRYVNEFMRRHEYFSASLALLIVLSLAYGVVVFFGFSLSAATYNPGVTRWGPYGYAGRWLGGLPVADPAAEGYQILPLRKLTMQYVLRGELPLWNPYLAAGTPLAADTSFSACAPLEFLNLLPNELWDFRTLMGMWLAGFLMLVFLRELKLNKHSAFIGAVLYMLSGLFTMYPNMNWTNVIVFTPLLLFSIERLVQRTTLRHILMTGIVQAICILGGFLEVVALQFVLSVLYLLFRSIEAKKQHAWKPLIGFAVSLTLGLGLSAFFTIPVLEYLSNSFHFHGPSIGLADAPSFLAITYFIPYFMGGLQSYWTEAFRTTGNPWDIVTGYVGIASLFLTLVALSSSLDKKFDSHARRSIIFFFAVSLIALGKTFGVPLTNWIGYLPVLNAILFPRYLGTIWIFCFSVTAAYGVDCLASHDTRLRYILMSSALSLLVVISLASLSVPFIPRIHNPVFHYPFYMLLQGSLFLFAITMCSAKICQKEDLSCFVGLVSIVILEMSLYVPLGLPYPFEALRSAFVLLTTLVLIGWILMSDSQFIISVRGIRALIGDSKFNSSFNRIRVSKTQVTAFILLFALTGQMLVAAISPRGLPKRYDAFTPAPYLEFLGKHAGFSRVFSFDGVLSPNFAGIFGFYHLGIMSGINVNSFHSFVVNNLDSGVYSPLFTGLGFRDQNVSFVEELRANEMFWSLLGVKYIVTTGTNLSHIFRTVYDENDVTIYENPTVFPRAFIVHRFQTASSFEEAQDMIRNPGFNLRECLVLDASPSESDVRAMEQAPVSDRSAAEIIRYEPDRVVIRAYAEHPGLLVLTDTFYPGWNAYVDGKPTRIYQADGLVRAVYVGEGEYTVEFVYSPESFKIGLAITMVSVAAVLTLATKDKLKSRIKKNSASYRCE
jgi:hypothetical protein